MMMKNTRKKITHLRLNEAGDFRNQEEIRKWNYIASRLWNKHKIKTYTYTHRSDLDFSRAPFLVVNGSVPGIKGAARSYICKDRKTFDSMVLGPNERKCPADCTKCHMCTDRKFKGTIYVRKH